MQDIASRLSNRVQLTTDGYRPYLTAVDDAFDVEIDYAQLIKIYGQPKGHGNDKKYNPAKCTGIDCNIVSVRPDKKFVSTSYVVRQNLTMRMHMKRFTRLTNAFSKKIENHCYTIALHFIYYNFVKIHKSLRVPPAMQAGLIKRFMSIKDIVNLVEDEAPKKEVAIK